VQRVARDRRVDGKRRVPDPGEVPGGGVAVILARPVGVGDANEPGIERIPPLDPLYVRRKGRGRKGAGISSWESCPEPTVCFAF
jgi:hypothetical protein